MNLHTYIFVPHLYCCLLHFQNFDNAWKFWVVGACFVGNIALEVFPALHLSEEAANRQYSQLKAHSHILQHGQIYLVIWTNTFGYLDPFISVFGQEYLGIVANTNVLAVFPAFLLWHQLAIFSSSKRNWTIGRKTLTQLGQIHLEIWTNTFNYLDKYI